MPLPTAAELTDPNATNAQMKQRLGQLAENVQDKLKPTNAEIVDFSSYLQVGSLNGQTGLLEDTANANHRSIVNYPHAVGIKYLIRNNADTVSGLRLAFFKTDGALISIVNLSAGVMSNYAFTPPDGTGKFSITLKTSGTISIPYDNSKVEFYKTSDEAIAVTEVNGLPVLDVNTRAIADAVNEYLKAHFSSIDNGFSFQDKYGFEVFKVYSDNGVLKVKAPGFEFSETSAMFKCFDHEGFEFDLLKFIERMLSDVSSLEQTALKEENSKISGSFFEIDALPFSIRIIDEMGFTYDALLDAQSIRQELNTLKQSVRNAGDTVATLQSNTNALMQPHLKPYRHPCATIKKGLNIVIVGGQSFSLGAQSATIVTREPSQRGNLMLGGSPRGKHGEMDDTNYTFDPFGGNVYQTLQECGQTKTGTIVNLSTTAGYYGETVLSGMLESLKDYHNRDVMLANDTDVIFAGSCCGTGGATIDQLSKATNTFYQRFTTCLDGHVAAAQAAGYTNVQVAAIVFMQGQANTGTANAVYKAALNQMRADMIADVKSRFAQADDPAFFLHQVGGVYPASTSTQMGVSNAQLEFSAENEGVFLLDNEFGYPSPGAHLYPNGYRWLGCRFAKRMYSVLKGKAVVDFKIVDAVYKNGSIYVAFSAPHKLSTQQIYRGVTAINDPTLGFTVRNASGALTIASVDIVSPSVVKITLAQETSAALTLWLGSSYNQGGHNLCDSSKEQSIFNYVYDGTMQQASAENIAEYVGKPYSLNEKPAVQFINVRSI